MLADGGQVEAVKKGPANMPRRQRGRAHHERWCQLLTEAGYHMVEVILAFTRRYGGLDNAEVRADHEVVIAAEEEAP